MQDMAHLSITLTDAIYRRLKREIPPKQISRFIEEAVQKRLRPSPKELEAAYKAAAKEPWRDAMTQAWDEVGLADWPEQ